MDTQASASVSISQADVDLTGSAVKFTSTNGGVQFGAPSGGDLANFSVSIEPATSGPLATGTHTASATADSTHYGVVITRNVASCNDTRPGTGTVDIKQLTTNASGDITAFAASYTIACLPDVAPIAGELRFNSSIGYIDGGNDQADLQFGMIDIDARSTPQTVTVSSAGSEPLVVGGATIGGDDPSAFAITADTCSHKSVAAGSSCMITLIASPNTMAAPSPDTAVLTIPDNSGLGSRTVSLSVDGNNGPVGTYNSLMPYRILDTRHGTGAPQAPLGAGKVLRVRVGGTGSVLTVPPSGVSAVVLNVTVTNATASSFLTIYPDGAPRPTASNLNFVAGQTVANAVTVQASTTGYVDIYNSTGSTNVIADVSGYYVGADGVSAGATYFTVAPTRILDTRKQKDGALPSHYYATIPVDFGATINPAVFAFAVNITVVNPKASGFLTAYTGSTSTVPNASTLNFLKGQTVANMAIVPTSTCGTAQGCKPSLPQIAVDNASPASTDIVVDIVGMYYGGWMAGGMRFHPMVPTRITDTRHAIGAPGALGPKTIDTIQAPATVTDARTEALALNVTAVSPTTSTFLSLWPADGTQPNVSTLNPAAHQTVANAAYTTLSASDQFKIFNNAGTTGVVIDVAGTFDLYSWPAPTAQSTTQAETTNKSLTQRSVTLGIPVYHRGQ